MSEAVLGPTVNDYIATARLIKEAVAGLSEEQLEWKPAPEKWSVKEIASHLVDSSLVHSVRVRKILTESTPPFLGYEQDAWVSASRSNQAPIHEILRTFEAFSAYNGLFYERLSEADWGRVGLHNGHEVTVSELFQSFIRHVNIHLAQIDRTKAAFRFA